MPTYTFLCDTDNKGCGNSFKVTCSMEKILELKPKCSNCRKSKPVIRDWSSDNIYIGDATPTTVGALAERNGERMSTDEINHIQTKNRIQKPKFAGTLPEGASLLPVDSKGKKVAPKKKGKDLGRLNNG